MVAVSPHLDDAAFSAGGTLWQLADSGAEVVVATAFTATVPQPQGFALACQLDKGLGAEVDYMALRRGEDAVAQDFLGANPLHLGLPEAPHRGYDSPAALFGPTLPDDDALTRVVGALERELTGRDVTLVLGPQALGSHVDHRHVRDAVALWASRRRIPLASWRDAPYVIREPQASTGREVPVGLGEAALQAKVRACAAYASQLGFQFGGADAVPAALRALASTDGRRLGLPGHAEAFVTAPGATQVLQALTQPRRLRP